MAEICKNFGAGKIDHDGLGNSVPYCLYYEPASPSGEVAQQEGRETRAARLIDESGKTVHASDCSTSLAPGEEPGPCDCDAPQPAGTEPEQEGWCSSCDKLHPCERPECPDCGDYLIFAVDDSELSALKQSHAQCVEVLTEAAIPLEALNISAQWELCDEVKQAISDAVLKLRAALADAAKLEGRKCS